MSEIQKLRSERHASVAGDKGDDRRSDFRRDRDRILYSSAFRRLSGITQVVSPSGSHPTHNRLTHSLEVAQIARSIAERLIEANSAQRFDSIGGLDPDVAEAAALAHDLGHPPFGHVAESTLNDLFLKDNYLGGFEGNAQSFRIVTTLSTRYKDINGLNLTRATLSAMSKYPWTRTTSKPRSEKWGCYDSEKEILEWSRVHIQSEFNERKTIEAEIMDWSDDFAYAVHDLEDFYRVGLVPLDRLTNSVDEQNKFLASHLSRKPELEHSAREEVLRNLVSYFPAEPYSGTRYGKATLRSLTSNLINSFVSSLEFDGRSNTIQVPEEISIQVELLKSMTWHYVIHSRALITTRYGYSTVIKSLFNMLTNATRMDSQGHRHNLGIFPDFFLERMEVVDFEKDEIPRVVADTIASLTEAQAISLHQRLTGNSLGEVLDPIL